MELFKVMDIVSLSKKISYQIGKAENILVVIHPKPDADALGSMAAINFWLKGLGKKYTNFCLHQPPANLSWLLDFEPLQTNFDSLGYNYDLLVFLDCGDLDYAGFKKNIDLFGTSTTIVNIDHHFTNDYFGQINIVDPLAVSTTEVIYRIFKSLGLKFPPKIASALLAGIIGDTCNFLNPNTNYQSLATASELLSAGAKIDSVSDSIFKNKNIDTLKIWGKILFRLSYNKKLKMVSTVVTKDDFKTELLGPDVTEGVANFLNNLGGMKAALILQQEDGDIVKGSLRTNDDSVDVSKLAKFLGGGGHKKAAGFRIKGRLVKTGNGGWQIV